MPDKKPLLQLQCYMLPHFKAAETHHKAIPVAMSNIRRVDFSMSVNSLVVNAKMTLIDMTNEILIGQLMQKDTPLMLLKLVEVDSSGNELIVVNDVISELFAIRNIKFTNTANRVYAAILDLVSTHFIYTDEICAYSNHDELYANLDILQDINAIMSKYSSVTGAGVNCHKSDDVFGSTPGTIKRRCCASVNDTVSDMMFKTLERAYEPAHDESIVSDMADANNRVASKLVGYTVNIDTNNIDLFRLNTDDAYSVELIENDYTRQSIPLRFSGTVDYGQCATIALPMSSEYTSLMQHFGINGYHIYYDQSLGRVIASTAPNKFAANSVAYLGETTSVLPDDMSIFTTSTTKIKPAIPPEIPIEYHKYAIDDVREYLKTKEYSGINTNHSTYAKHLKEIVDNNMIYLNVTRSFGHKVGQSIELYVEEFGDENNAAYNYELNLAFAGKWKILKAGWHFINDGLLLQCSETLGITRFNSLKGDSGVQVDTVNVIITN